MKNKISFLAIIAIALNVNYVCASECVGEDCEFFPIEINQSINTAEMLVPVEQQINWIEPTQVCEYDYNCPFETAEECAIWYKKPVFKTSVNPRAPHINPMRVDDIIYEIYSNCEISANSKSMSPLVERYTMLMNAGDACCTAGIIYKMRERGADDRDVYEFLKNDANHFAITKRCLVMSDANIAQKYSHGVTGQMVAEVRDACLCKNRQWFDSLLQPFNDIYERIPNFKSSDFTYEFKDGMNRELTVSINSDVQNSLGTLANCPK